MSKFQQKILHLYDYQINLKLYYMKSDNLKNENRNNKITRKY